MILAFRYMDAALTTVEIQGYLMHFKIYIEMVRLINQIRTVEKMLKLVLSKITVCGHFNTFKIDSTVGGCWLNDCVDMRNRLTNTQKALCKNVDALGWENRKIASMKTG